ncbi:hypothetical protein UlMin_029900 [Ulmus minor]
MSDIHLQNISSVAVPGARKLMEKAYREIMEKHSNNHAESKRKRDDEPKCNCACKCKSLVFLLSCKFRKNHIIGPLNDKSLFGLKDCMKKGYSYLEGVEELLCSLRQKNYEMHTFTNYPIWYEMIEDKLQISRYLSWTFCSCKNGKRKPDPDFYLDALEHLEVDPANYIFAAIAVGIVGLHFKNADILAHTWHRWPTRDHGACRRTLNLAHTCFIL